MFREKKNSSYSIVVWSYAFWFVLLFLPSCFLVNPTGHSCTRNIDLVLNYIHVSLLILWSSNCFLFQGIAHESCEKVMVQNNLCFGKCSSFHVPGPEDRLYTFCSQCMPTKFSMKRLYLNCTNSVPVVKEVMIVEECKCEIQKIKDPVLESQQSDLHENAHEHN